MEGKTALKRLKPFETIMKSIILLNFCKGVYGGIESFLLNAFYCLDKEKYDVTFLTCGRSTYDMFREDIISQHGHIDEIPIFPGNYNNKLRLFKALRVYFREKKPDIVHVNSGTLSYHMIAAKAAKLENINRIILHSHNFLPNPNGIRELLKSWMKKQLWKNGDSFLACSMGAAFWMFPKEKVEQGKVIVIPNGIDTERFKFSKEKRDAFRKSIGVTDELLIGNIGRFQGQKNHVFMIEIMEEVVKNNPSAKLILVGEGDLKKDIIEIVNKKNLSNNVVFLGERKDVDAFLSAIDIFIFPSIYEGFGIATIEAQAAGAKVIISNNVPKETNVTGEAIYLPIVPENAAKLWEIEINNSKRNENRYVASKIVYEAGYDVHLCYRKMISIYDEESSDVNNK